ncbi:hypothetical protein LOAG_02434 [Loa loa]|uniref:Uncharacterized protein n=1 Tax=Loa loa TaxID=7209 RepID=A0A1S0U6G8_LOALO|nr:hypothetical protein LOAG_02434 [Loa loa]EFO26051.1 hypothetical protein LOAG_02434 [Loa loa]
MNSMKTFLAVEVSGFNVGPRRSSRWGKKQQKKAKEEVPSLSPPTTTATADAAPPANSANSVEEGRLTHFYC